MQIVIDIHERDFESFQNGNVTYGIIDAIKNGTPLVDILTDFVEWQGLPFPNKNVFMNAPILIAETYLKEKNDADSD